MRTILAPHSAALRGGYTRRALAGCHPLLACRKAQARSLCAMTPDHVLPTCPPATRKPRTFLGVPDSPASWLAEWEPSGVPGFPEFFGRWRRQLHGHWHGQRRRTSGLDCAAAAPPGCWRGGQCCSYYQYLPGTVVRPVLARAGRRRLNATGQKSIDSLPVPVRFLSA